jgi:hypothetical protein
MCRVLQYVQCQLPRGGGGQVHNMPRGGARLHSCELQGASLMYLIFYSKQEVRRGFGVLGFEHLIEDIFNYDPNTNETLVTNFCHKLLNDHENLFD